MGAEKTMFKSKDIIYHAVTIVAAVKVAGLVETLKGKGPFTVFAPTNGAFENLPARQNRREVVTPCEPNSFSLDATRNSLLVLYNKTLSCNSFIRYDLH